MDFFRRMLGIPYSHPRNDNQFPDIYNEDYQNGSHTPPFGFPFGAEFHRGQNVPSLDDDGHHPFHRDPFHGDTMQHMQQMMDLMDQMMAGMLLNPDIQGFHGLELPQPPMDPGVPNSPRDQLLKEPDTPTPGEGEHSKFSPHSDIPHTFPHHGEALGDAFSLLDQFMYSFSNPDTFTWAHDYNHGGDNNPLMLPAPRHQTPRDTLIKKEDQDLDICKSGGLSELLRDGGPAYSYRGRDGATDTGTALEPYQQQPQVQRIFKSTSIIRTIKPDGSMKERRTYRDSSGKEEVTVTEVESPGGYNRERPLLPPSGSGQDPFSSGSGDDAVFRSIFGKFMK